MAMYKMTPAIRAKISASQKARFATSKTKSAKRGRPSRVDARTGVDRVVPQAAIYVGESPTQPAVDVNRLEERAFRRGMFTALQMVVDVLIRELR